MTSQFTHGVEWEDSFGYSQAFRAGNTIYASGQLAHDAEGNLIGAGDCTAQMNATFSNIDKILAHYGATRSQIVNDVLMVVNIRENVSQVAAAHRAYFGDHRPTSTTLGVVGLAFEEQLVEVAVTIRLDI